MSTDHTDALRKLVNEQAKDEGLWFVARTAAEAYLQQELRKLHAAVEASPTVAPADERRMDLYSELAEALGCDVMDSHEGRLEIARRSFELRKEARK